MNTIVTSREELLHSAKEIALREGIAKINIRRVASACGVATGSLYNYFPAKADLIMAVVEDFWRGAFHGLSWPDPSGGFPAFFAELHRRFTEYLDSFQTDWLAELSSLSAVERRKGKEMEAFYFDHIRQGLIRALKEDRRIPAAFWTGEFTQESFSAFLLDNLLSLLRRRERDCSFFCQILTRLLYGTED